MEEPSQSRRDVFISHSIIDKPWADDACAAMEARQISCWIAPRDILAGSEWGASIVEGIDACRVMVLIFSQDANSSPQVRREIERAIAKGLIVLPFRVEDVKPSGAMEFALSNTHWLDGFKTPKQRQLDLLADSVKQLLAGNSTSAIRPAVPSSKVNPRSRYLLLAAGAFAVLVVAALCLILSNLPDHETPPLEPPALLEAAKPARSPAAVLFVDGPTPRQFQGIVTAERTPFSKATLVVLNVKEHESGRTGTFAGLLEWDYGKPGHNTLKIKLEGAWNDADVTMKSVHISSGNQNAPFNLVGVVSGNRLNGTWGRSGDTGKGTFDLRAKN